MKPSWLFCAAAIYFSNSGIMAADSQELSADDKKKATALISDLGADEFQTRENAEKVLATLGGNVLPLVKEVAANTADAEVRSRCERIIKVLALEVEKDPALLAKIAKEEATAKHFADAAKYYAKTGRIYTELAANPENEKSKIDLLAKAKKANDRMRRAENLAKALGGEDGQQVIVGGGRRIVIHAGGVVVSDESSEDGEDW